MPTVKPDGIAVIVSLRKRWLLFGTLANGVLLLAVELLVWAAKDHLPFPLTVMLLVMFVLLAVYKTREFWQRLDERNVARFLNQKFPVLEESSELVLVPVSSLNLLQQLQAEKVGEALTGLPVPPEVARPLKRSGIVFAVALLVVISAMALPDQWSRSLADKFTTSGASTSTPPESRLPGIEQVTVSITPPAYTRKSPHNQSLFAITAEEGARITWELETSGAVKTIRLLFNDGQSMVLRASSDATHWSGSRTVHLPGFYQVEADGRKSEFYKLDVVHDQAPVIRIAAPATSTTIDYGEAPKVMLRATLWDDYGINSAAISATVATGKAEGVKFKEFTLPFAASFTGTQQQYNLQKMIDLTALGMHPGDELYFYVKTIDNHLQESRSDIYFVTITDTAKLMSLDGLGTGVNRVPEYFRSQRQIIIDTEKLLKDKDSISAESFKTRSANIGVDQKLLRLRYGKFLGNENEEASNPADEAPFDPADFNNEAKLKDQYAEHDDGDEAGFFEPKQKKQLKEMLNEMWSSELRLLTYRPADALPFEYKALRMLKDIQQDSRVYVAKTSYKVPPLKEDKRLSGELDKISAPLVERRLKAKTQADGPSLAAAVALLQRMNFHTPLRPADQQALDVVFPVLSTYAAAQPSTFLPALTALHRLMASTDERQAQNDRLIVEKAMQKIIPKAPRLPQKKEAPKDALSDNYFNDLQK